MKTTMLKQRDFELSKTINLHSRDKEPNFDYIKNIFNKNYIYYEGRCA